MAKRKSNIIDSFVFKNAKIKLNKFNAIDTDTKTDDEKSEQHLSKQITTIVDNIKPNVDTLTPEHVDTLTPEHVDTLTPEHVDNVKSEQVSKHVDTLTPEHVDTLTPEHVDTLTPEHVDTLTPEHVDTLTPEHVDTLTHIQLPAINYDKKPADLKLNQYIILHEIYYKRPFKVNSPYGIGKNANIPYGTIRYIIRALVKKGYIEKPFLLNTNEFKGQTCQVNEIKLLKIFGVSPIDNSIQVKQCKSEHVDTLTPEHVDTLTPEHVDTLTPEHVDNLTSEQVKSLKVSSSSFKNNLLTKIKIELEKPDYIFWQDQELSPKKINSWINEFEFEFDEIFDYLKYEAYNLEKNNGKDKQKKPIENYFNWLYRIFAKNGTIDKPKGFLTFAEKRIAAKKKRLDEKKKRVEKEEAFKKEEIEFNASSWMSELKHAEKTRIVKESNNKVLIKQLQANPNGISVKNHLIKFYEANKASISEAQIIKKIKSTGKSQERISTIRNSVNVDCDTFDYIISSSDKFELFGGDTSSFSKEEIKDCYVTPKGLSRLNIKLKN